MGDMTLLPPYVSKLFWGDNLEELSWENHQKYITEIILNKGDSDSVKWLFERSPKTALLSQLKSLKLTPKSANFWSIYLHE